METFCQLNTSDHARVIYGRRPAMRAATNDPLVLIHGAASNMTRWSEFAATTTLAASHDILRLDLRGHGRSVYRGRIGLETWCDDIAAILHQEGRSRAIPVGHCLGANVALMFAARHPQLTRGVVLVEPMLRQALVGKLRRLTRMTSAVKAIIAVIRLCNRCGIYRRRLATLDLRELDKDFQARLAEPGGSERLERRYASPWHDLKIMPSANFLQDLLEVVRPLPVAELRAPFLALLSTGRSFVDPEITAALLAGLTQGEIHTLEARHWIPTEQPEAMRAMIDTWVARLMG